MNYKYLLKAKKALKDVKLAAASQEIKATLAAQPNLPSQT